MKKKLRLSERISLIKLGLMVAIGGAVWAPARACTIFVLTDTNRAFFCNNEDWSNPNTRIWFVPGTPKHYGHVYVGFDNGWAQGGLNTEGLAFDWVAGYKEEWSPDPSATNVSGNPSEQMLETCAAVDEAIAYFRSHKETSFTYAKILVADRTGASVIIGAEEGKLQVEQSRECRGFGYGARTLDKMLAAAPEPTVANGAKILQACRQTGQYATKYFNIFDLKSGDIFLHPFPTKEDEVNFHLADELKRGAHYYDMPQIHDQLGEVPRPLLPNMQRNLLDKYKPIPDREPKITEHIRAMTQDVRDGTLHRDDFTDDAWKEVAPTLKEAQADLKSFGALVSMAPVDRSEEGGKRTYRYRMEFEKTLLVQRFVFDEHNKLVSSETEDIRQNP
jgi:hypothetical protein